MEKIPRCTRINDSCYLFGAANEHKGYKNDFYFNFYHVVLPFVYAVDWVFYSEKQRIVRHLETVNDGIDAVIDAFLKEVHDDFVLFDCV